MSELHKSISELLVEERRAGLVECEYAGHVCGISDTGEIRYFVGNPRHMTFMRSAAKPFQALPAFKHGIADQYGFTGKEQAITTASHRSEPFHVDVLESMLGKIGIDEQELVCHSSYPLNERARDTLVAEGKPPRRLYHNCSGKHLGVLAYCKSKGYPLEGYEQLDHPVQQEILETLAEMADYPQEQIHIGIDGCGFPVFAIPLANAAKAYLKLACPDLIGNADSEAAVSHMTGMMNKHYEMVSGSDMICSSLLMDDNIVAKGGAQGVYCFGLRKERMAFALKVMDGSESKWALIVASILEQIGYTNADTIARLYRLCPEQTVNGSGTAVGEQQAVFRLEKV
ncbi:asparaginase [Paenibacillaceae bacterium]|nr:asparaginase [Paenibacillaceae bacterium]